MKTEINTLLKDKVKIVQEIGGLKASSDAVLLSAVINEKLAKKIKTVLDVGTGGGAISLCLKYKYKHLDITGIDKQENLLDLFNKSIKENNFENIRGVKDDIFNIKNIKENIYDLVITNPPYYTGTLSPNKTKAIAHNQQDINLCKWIEKCLKKVRVRGYFAIIHQTERLDDIIFALKSNNIGDIKIYPIVSKVGKLANRVVILSKKHSKSSAILYKETVIYGKDNKYTKTAVEILEEGKSLQL